MHTVWSRAPRGITTSILALLTVVGLVAGTMAINATAGADTTVSPSGPGAIDADTLVRDSSIALTVNPVAYTFYRSGSNAAAASAAAYARADVPALGTAAVLQSLLPAILFPASANFAGCRGDNPAGPTAHGGSNNSPRTTLTVTDPNGHTVLSQVSPAITEVSLIAADNYKVRDPQPTAPENTAYRGGRPPTATPAPPVTEPGRPWATTLELTGRPVGTYTVTETTQNMLQTKTGNAYGACTIGTPTPGATPGTYTNASTPGPVVTTSTFEYRPWQYTFTDLGGAGRVSFNTNPAESKQKLGDVEGAIVPGGMSFYALPSADAFALPSDPVGCASDPASCLPTGAVACSPAAGCEPRIVIINRTQGSEQLTGVFDLETHAFISYGRIGNTHRFLLSLGDQLDPVYRGLISTLRTQLAGAGLDIDGLLQEKIILAGADAQTEISLLNGLQVNPASVPGGIHLVTAPAVQAGLLLNIYAAANPVPAATTAVPAPCTASGSSASSAEYHHTPGLPGYDVVRSDVLPNVPAVAGLDALGVGGPIWNVRGTFGKGDVANTSTMLAGVGLNTDDASLLSASALISSTGNTTVTPKKMDFLGTAMWNASETPLLGSCLTVDLMLGVGAALYDNFLPIGLNNLPVWGTNPLLTPIAQLLNSALAAVVGDVTTNPAVADLLSQVLAIVPPVDTTP